MRCAARLLCSALGAASASAAHAAAQPPARRRQRHTQTIDLGNGLTITVRVPRSRKARTSTTSERCKDEAASEVAALVPQPLTTTTHNSDDSALWDRACTSSGYLSAIQGSEQHLTCRAMLRGWAELKEKDTSTRTQDMEATWQGLRQEALPVLLSLTAEVPDGASRTAAQLVQSQRCVVHALALLEAMTRTTGRRYERAFPAWLVAALWRTAMPRLHSMCLTSSGRASTVQLGTRTGDAKSTAMVQRPATQTPTVTRTSRKALKEAFRAARRALALRTVAIADVMPVDTLAYVLASMQDCGAMSDDVLSPILTELLHRCEALLAEGETRSTPRRSVSNPLVRRCVTRRLDTAQLPCSAEGALVMLRVLGRQSLPYHSGAHRLVHSLLLPAVEDSLAALAAQQQQEEAQAEASSSSSSDSSSAALPRQMLIELTTCFVRYAVSGPAVGSLTALWLPVLQASSNATRSSSATALQECTQLLQILVGGSRALAPSPTRRPRYLAANAVHDMRPDKLHAVAAEDYQPLVEATCARLAQLCHSESHAAHTNSLASGREEAAAWAELLCVLCRVNSVAWFDLYSVVASAVLRTLLTSSPAAPETAEGNTPSSSSQSAVVLTSFPTAMAVRVLRAILYRNTLVPQHALHSVLLRHVLHSPEALQDSRTAGSALVAMAVMMRMPTTTNTSASNVSVAVENDDDDDGCCCTAEDRAAALRLFRRHGTRLPLSAFAAALAVVPLDQLPAKSHGRVVQHFTQIAVALSPRWLVRGMAGLTRQLPRAVDEVSLQRWFSRFTARDVVAKVDMPSCVTLLQMLTLRDSAATDSALAKQSIVRRVVRLLRQSAPETQVAVLATLPQLVNALRATDSFFAFIFARLSRLLLGQVEQATWAELLPGFAAMAEEYTRRSLGERHGSVFRDVWEMLRGRVMQDAGASLRQDSTTTAGGDEHVVWPARPLVMAYNGFAQLDVTDRPLFAVLTHQLLAQLQEMAHKEPAKHDEAEEDGVMTIDVTAAAQHAGSDAKDEHVQADNPENTSREDVAVAPLLAALSPSAVAVLTASLIYAIPQGPMPAANEEEEEEKDAAVSSAGLQLRVLTAALVQLQACSAELYPMDVLHVMPYLLRVFAELSALELTQPASDSQAQSDKGAVRGESVWARWGRVPLHQTLLHRAYDACRELFLLMFTPQPKEMTSTSTAPASDAAQTPSPISNTTSTNITTGTSSQLPDAIAEQRRDWSPRVWSSVRQVPKPLFAELLAALCNASLADDAVAEACASHLCSSARTCEKVLTAAQLVDVCMALCFFRAAATEREARGGAAVSPLQGSLAVVLTALWQRSEELSVRQIDALLHCLRDCFGAKVDADFVERLQSQRALLRAKPPRTTAQRQREEGEAVTQTDIASEASTGAAGQEEEKEDESGAAEALGALMAG